MTSEGASACAKRTNIEEEETARMAAAIADDRMRRERGSGIRQFYRLCYIFMRGVRLYSDTFPVKASLSQSAISSRANAS